MKHRIAIGCIAAASLLLAAAAAAAAGKAATIRMAIDEDPIVLRLASSLGYLEREGIDIVPVDLEKLAGEDYLMQDPLMKGRIDASYRCLNHAISSARH